MERTRTLQDVAFAMGASHYIVVEASASASGQPGAIVASNWTFDAIAVVGRPTISRLADAAFAVGHGPSPAPVLTTDLGPFPSTLDQAEIDLLQAFGHMEAICFRVRVGGTNYLALLTARAAGCIDGTEAFRGQLLVSYLVSELAPKRLPLRPANPLSDRERECLVWVAEGKTTDEIALIIGVSANTAGTYISHAIQKLGASNRAMAIAVAIRQGIL